MREVDPQEFANSTEFMDSLPDWRKKRLEDYMGGGLFISHSSADFPRWLSPESRSVLAKIRHMASARFGSDGYFFHNFKSGGAEQYRELVNVALTYCDKFLLLVSAKSVHSPWVRAEVQFALANQRPIIEAYLDDTDIEDLYSTLPAYLFHNHHSGRYSVKFNHDIEHGQAVLAQLLDQLLAQLPYPRKQMD